LLSCLNASSPWPNGFPSPPRDGCPKNKRSLREPWSSFWGGEGSRTRVLQSLSRRNSFRQRLNFHEHSSSRTTLPPFCADSKHASVTCCVFNAVIGHSSLSFPERI